MTETQPTEGTGRLAAAVRDYVEAVFREVMRIATRVGRQRDAGDVADEVAAEVLERPESIMARYPDPVRYARERVRHAGISLDRRDRVQRGEGARLFHGVDGLLRPGRTWLAGDAPVGEDGASVFSFARDLDVEFADVTLDRLTAPALVRRCCVGLTRSQVFELFMVDGCGYEVKDVAQMLGQCRETVSRRLSKTRRIVQQNRAAMSISEEFEG